MGCHFLFQGIFLTQGSNAGLLYCRQLLYPLSHQGSPRGNKQPTQIRHLLVTRALKECGKQDGPLTNLKSVESVTFYTAKGTVQMGLRLWTLRGSDLDYYVRLT